MRMIKKDCATLCASIFRVLIFLLVRSQAKESRVLDGIPSEQQCRISLVHINDITTDSFDEAVQDVDGIIHVASPVQFEITDPEKDFLLPAINGTIGVLQAAHKYNQNHFNKIKRIVITSSLGAVLDPTKGLRPGYCYTEKDWCPLTYEKGVSSKNDRTTAYLASKTLSERVVWDFLDKEKPSFTIATICPPLVLGPRVNGFESLDDINASNSLIWSLINSSKDAQIPDTVIPFQVDVRDLACIHVEVLERFGGTNQRFLIRAETSSFQTISDIIHEDFLIPDNIKNKTPIGTKGQKSSDHFTIDSSPVQNDLRIEYIPLKKTIEDLVLQFIELKEKLEHERLTHTE
ncbi:unnamed protein product [Rotaria magnacalcarata]|uniref:Thioester reductase (TE) domain-containing protein n=2 Tax=Rotaria magnacalcarata TaxID=392030 RepID=A0A816UCX3_9BILA|nr:unnamed protein product [Rotaria magnacalcarata]